MSKLLPVQDVDIFSNEMVKHLPSIEDIANLLKNIADKSLAEVCDYNFSIMSKELVRSELSIFGYCHKNERLECYSLKNSCHSQREFEIEYIDLYSTNFYLLGDKQEQIRESIENEYANYDYQTLNWWRAPSYALKNIVEQEQFETIGGKLQLARAYPHGADVIFPVTEEEVMEGTYLLGGFITTPRKMVL
ncbi:hypothetical protein [Aliivibrio fischeri]|uniref:hypothetical protein n=1 Tax=Aliivibrio fischeri TaxID=668 RepID=UPI0007C4C0BC|nr:hypothetical protein [Aliivibrio fischeri]